MPKIEVKERDLSWYYRSREPGQLVVLMPGVSAWGPEEPVLVDSTNIKQTLGEGSVSNEDFSYWMARSFVEAGINVLFWRIPLEGSLAASFSTNIEYVSPGSKEKSSHKIRVSAKYKGSYGNKLRVTISGSGNAKSFIVRDDRGNFLESLVYEFNNINSPYWYSEVNRESAFIEVECTDGESATDDFQENDGSTTLFELKQGSNGTYSREAVVNSICNNFDVVNNLKDMLIYDFNIIVDGGYNDVKSDASSISKVDKLFVDLANSRGSAVYLVSGEQSMSSDDFFSYCGYPADGETSGTLGFDTSYASAFGPWCSSKLIANGVTRTLPGYYPFLIAWGNSLANGTPLWMAPAGVKRSSLGNLVAGTQYPVGSAILDKWQNQDFSSQVSHGYKVNPIMKLKQYGYVVYGNSTLLKSRYDGSTSMLQSFSTRVMANMIKSRAFDISLSLQFDQIDNDIFSEFKVLMSSFLDQLKYGKALYSYEIVASYSEMTLDDLNSRTIPVTIKISPNPAAENFVINLEISQAGVSFGDDTDNPSASTSSEVV